MGIAYLSLGALLRIWAVSHPGKHTRSRSIKAPALTTTGSTNFLPAFLVFVLFLTTPAHRQNAKLIEIPNPHSTSNHKKTQSNISVLPLLCQKNKRYNSNPFTSERTNQRKPQGNIMADSLLFCEPGKPECSSNGLMDRKRDGRRFSPCTENDRAHEGFGH